ncbi:MAG: MATE family efflux transporter [Lachnospiraceae bacterium]|nr:MATE family efflux transporter [Lachnospiraceae bacterium]
MTEGSISKKILLFALPVFLGQLLQQLYNVVDSIVVGNTLGKEALAAVSSSGSLIFLVVGFINGLFMGAGVIISNRFGAKDYNRVHTAVHTAIGFGLLSGIFMTFVGVFGAPVILRWMGTPLDVYPNSVLYLRIFFMGGLGNVMYNTCCGIYQAVGDSKHPLYYLIASTIINTILDILFVIVLGLGIGGAAAATVIAQYLSASLAFFKLTRIDGYHRVELKKIKIDWEVLKQELKIGIPSGIQNSVIAIANVIVQSNINAFGSIAMAGSGSYAKLEGFAFLPINSFCSALTTFTSQNLGAGNPKRAQKGARFGVLFGATCSELIGVILFIGAPVFLMMFSKDPEVLAFGKLQVATESLFYFMLAYSHCMASIIRGAGKTSVPMFVMLGCWCLFRITYITIAVNIFHTIRTIYWAYPITWTMSSTIFTIYYFKTKPLKISKL